MVKIDRVRRKRVAPAGSTRSKGDLVEEVVASMHESEGVRVAKNVFLATQDPGRSREIDILLTSDVAGYPVHIAIECKNETTAVGVEEVDEFVGKLQDVGIPPQQGIFVSASRYTQGALKRAHRAGVKPLVFKDLTDEMPEAVRQAFQSIIYVIAEVTRFSIKNNIPRVEAQSDILQFRDDQGNLVGSVADLVWDHWQSGKIPLALGPHTVELTLPSGWRQIVDGQVAEVYSINVTVMALGCVITLAGKVRHVSLVDPTLQETERREISATFERPSGRVPLKMFSSEAELSDFLRSRGNIKLTLGRFRVPRIVWQGLYWPPTKKSYSRIVALLDAFQKGEIPDPRPFKLSEIEGDDLSEAWAPPWDDNPFIRNKTRPEG